MKKIILLKGDGKTTELIKMSAETGDYIVSHTMRDCAEIAARAKLRGFNIPYPISHHEFVNKGYYGKGIKGFLIDDVELLLQCFSNGKVKAITLSE